MSGVASKNPYDLLGNTSDEDPDRPAPAPVATVDKPAPRAGKRNTTGELPIRDAPTANVNGQRGGRGGRGGRGRGSSANDRAFLDRDAGSASNQERSLDDASGQERYATRMRGGRGGRGARRGGRGGPPPRDDRLSRNVHGAPDDQQKQAAHGWGSETGVGEWNNEKAAEADAKWEEEKATDPFAEGNVVDPGPINDAGEGPRTNEDGVGPVEEMAPEPEDKTKSLADWQEEQRQKKSALGPELQARRPNEGAKQDFSGTALEREETAYMAGSGAKARRERERKDRNVLALDHDIQARERDAPRGGRGGRGRGRGEFHGEGRGEFRGGRGRGRGGGEFRGEGRGEFRGGRGGRGTGPSPNLADTSAFPSLGS